MRRDSLGAILPPRTDWRSYDDVQAGARWVSYLCCRRTFLSTHPGRCPTCKAVS